MLWDDRNTDVLSGFKYFISATLFPKTAIFHAKYPYRDRRLNHASKALSPISHDIAFTEIVTLAPKWLIKPGRRSSNPTMEHLGLLILQQKGMPQ